MAATFFLKISRIEQETGDAKTFYLQPFNGEKIKYESGQFLTCIFHQNGKEIRRSYSLSSSPGIDSDLSITIKKEPNGAISRYMHDQVQTGDMLEALYPSGVFTIPYDAGVQRDIFLIAGGSGIVPIYSLLKSVLVKEPQSAVTLIYSNHNQASTIFYSQLLELRDRYFSQLYIAFLFSNYQHVLKARLSATSLEILLRQHLHFGKASALIYTCGPFGLMQMAQIVALSNGFSKDNIRKENFTIGSEADLSRQYFDHVNRAITLHYNGAAHHLPVEYNKSILNAALENGIELPYSCKAGRCSSCKARLLSGKVWMHYNEVLTGKDEAAGWVLTCTGHPVTGDVVIIV